MSRDWFINGETLVKVKGGSHMVIFGSGSMHNVVELGLASEPIVVRPRFFHHDIRTSDFGPNVPAEVMWNLAEVRISMTLIHFDAEILRQCVGESMGGMVTTSGTALVGAGVGIMRTAGTMMGAGVQAGGNIGGTAAFTSGCHYISLNLLSPVENVPYRFPTTYLSEPPIEFPLGTEKSAVRLNWRAIPYTLPTITVEQKTEDVEGVAVVTTETTREIRSKNVVLWDYQTQL